MSAIFGIIFTSPPESDAAFAAMQQAMAHRAKDGKGTYHDTRAFLATYQLITSVRQHNELLPYQEDEYVITCDSRLDNQSNIISLLGLPHKNHEIADACLILKLYRKYGSNCTDYLDGEFAFVIWNKETRTIFAATDHMGFRSFYYYYNGQAFVFASEIKGITAANQTPKRFDRNNTVNKFMVNFDGGTYDADIKQLPAATRLTWQCNEPHSIGLYNYWQLKKQGRYAFTNDNDWAACMRELIINAVNKRLDTDKPVGISLSGGLDSSFLAGILATELQKKNKPLYTISNVLSPDYTGTQKDERYYMELMGKKYPNIQQEFIDFSDGSGPFTNLVDTFERLEVLAYPFIYTDKRLFETASQKGIGLFFNGFGGDFAMSYKGDGLIYDQLKAGQLRAAFKSLAFIAADNKISFLQAFRTCILDNSFARKLYEPILPYLRLERQALLSKELAPLAAGKVAFGATASVKKRLAAIINTGTLGGMLFSTQKKLSASYGIESTVPLLDKNLMEFFMDIPPEQFLVNNWQRSLMRRAMDGFVPQEIQWRKDKKPFVLDFTEKFIQSHTYIDTVLQDASYERSRQALHVDRFKTLYGAILEGKRNNTDCRIAAWAVELVAYLHWLEAKGYFYK
ncbi:asparagine synthase-related protein [Emticicia sp. 21SJ11W-3]|uniref:asparagine synthase-related protein n=1 Tax=Emticicia sp. 21SJ11W-3 TaxID=2916755 RepID=UPI00209E61AD|nr:asparagine synthase-related protein [Emticicia sp. 21SJ11W-3]UTA66425.1 asparagine synthase-related protein [Emticicia sp. 21SJ11W-3]